MAVLRARRCAFALLYAVWAAFAYVVVVYGRLLLLADALVRSSPPLAAAGCWYPLNPGPGYHKAECTRLRDR